jgi:hypothetical protein
MKVITRNSVRVAAAMATFLAFAASVGAPWKWAS